MSKTLATIGLNGAKFKAPIGWYPEERIFKNEFLVDLSVSFEPSLPFIDDDLDASVDYMLLYQICEEVFGKETKLIETVAQAIINQIIEQIPLMQKVSIQIKKLNPPVKAQIASSFVQLTFEK